MGAVTRVHYCDCGKPARRKWPSGWVCDQCREMDLRRERSRATRPAVGWSGWLAVIPCGEYWCIRPLKAPLLCLIREVSDEDALGNPLPKTAIRFLSSGADFYFDRWRELYAPDATFVPVLPPNAQRERPAEGGEK